MHLHTHPASDMLEVTLSAIHYLAVHYWRVMLAKCPLGQLPNLIEETPAPIWHEQSRQPTGRLSDFSKKMREYRMPN
jgi:hypothetical protein